MGRPKGRTCYRCGNPATTRDHIPGDGIFPDPKPSNLITVACCTKCNQGISSDEEYFRAVITPAMGNSRYAERLIDQRIIRGFRKRTALLHAIMRKAKEVDFYSEGGIYLGKVPAIQVDTQRLQNVIEKIVRGLFWHEERTVLGDGYLVNRFLINPPFDENIQAGIVSIPIHNIGDGQVFSYRYLVDAQDTRTSCWFLMFFNGTLFMAMTEAVKKRL